MMRLSNWYDNSSCKGCVYGEHITSGVFCNEIQEVVPVGYQGCKAEHDYYDEMYKRENGMTLEELAKELRKILPRTRYVTVGDNPKASIVGDKIVSIFYERDGRKPKPEYNKDPMRPNTWGLKHPKLEVYGKPFYAPGFYQFYVHEVVDLDLSEYEDADGNIDYSKCIVEVE